MTAIAAPQSQQPVAKEFEARTCPVTALKVDLVAEKLIIANAVSAVVCLALGGLFALLIALTRWQAIHLLDPVWFYRLITAHGIDMLVAWIVFFEIGGLYFGSTVLLNARMVTPRLAWFAFGLMVLGGLMVNVVIFTTNTSDVMFTAYVPMKAHPLFYLSYIIFAVGALIALGVFFGNLAVAKRERRYQGSLPLVVFGLATAAILAVYTLLEGAMTFIPAFLWSLGIISEFDPMAYRNLFWGFGHPAQQVNLAAMVSIWYMLVGITVGGKPVNEKLSRLAFILYLFFINLGSVHHLLVDPGTGFWYKMFNTSYGMYLAVLGSLIHAFSIPAAIEIALRLKGHKNGLFEWLRKAPWKEPGWGGLIMSIFIFGWIGGVTGVTLGTEQINMVAHNTMRIPGHFHSTVVGGTTTAFMAISYYLIPLIFRKELKLKKWATWQPYVYGFGMILVSVGMITAGLQGVPRRHWDISFANALFPVTIPGTVEISLAILGIGALMAVTGGIMYVSIVLVSILTGKRTEASQLLLVTGKNNPLVESASVTYEEMERPAVQPKGTFVLVLAFLMWFMLYYFGNWWLLGRTWFIR